MMSKRAFDKIAAGLDEAIAIARGDAKPARLYVPRELDIKSIRAKTGLSQFDFAHQFGFTSDQIKSWEQTRSRPLGGVRAYLLMIDTDHEAVMRVLSQGARWSNLIALTLDCPLGGSDGSVFGSDPRGDIVSCGNDHRRGHTPSTAPSTSLPNQT